MQLSKTYIHVGNSASESRYGIEDDTCCEVEGDSRPLACFKCGPNQVDPHLPLWSCSCNFWDFWFCGPLMTSQVRKSWRGYMKGSGSQWWHLMRFGLRCRWALDVRPVYCTAGTPQLCHIAPHCSQRIYKVDNCRTQTHILESCTWSY